MGVFSVDVVRGEEVVESRQVQNRIFEPFFNYMLDGMFNGGVITGPLYVGLIDAVGFTAIDDSDVMSSHAGWNEMVDCFDLVGLAEQRAETVWNRRFLATTPYDRTFINYKGSVDVRDVIYQAMTQNTSRSVMQVKRGALIQGLFLSTVQTLGSTSGLLAAAAAFDAGPISVVPGDFLWVRYEINFASTLGLEYPWPI